MSCIQETWDWIRLKEERYMDTDIPFSDRDVSMLIKKLRIIEPYLQRLEPDNETFEHFASKMEVKFIKTPYHQRFMLFDFVKDLIHRKLIMGGSIEI